MNLDNLKNVFALIGGLATILGLFKVLFEIIPKFRKLLEDVYKGISTKYKNKNIEKKAIACNIENIVNDSVRNLNRELPGKWISRAKIEWVNEEKEEDLEEDELILRIKPIENQDVNIMNGIYYFFSKALFPDLKEVIPSMPRKAVVLQLTRRTINQEHPYALKDFEKKFVEASIRNDEGIIYYLGNFNDFDKRGFLTSAFIREITNLAEKIRFSPKRAHFLEDINSIVNHIASFIENYNKTIPDELWCKRDDNFAYGFLLVARPYIRESKIYVKRANKHLENGIKHLYILGANQERDFVREVIREIRNNTNYELVELLKLDKDYRGESGGICAVFSSPDEKEIIETNNLMHNESLIN
jgi:hypothetical protein